MFLFSPINLMYDELTTSLQNKASIRSIFSLSNALQSISSEMTITITYNYVRVNTSAWSFFMEETLLKLVAT